MIRRNPLLQPHIGKKTFRSIIQPAHDRSPLQPRESHLSRESETVFQQPARCLSHGELFGGKIAAALDRQHPRDLFDVKLLLDSEGLAEEVRLGTIAALVSHGRPIVELVRPRSKDQRDTFRSQFEGMPFLPFTYDDHEDTLDRLVTALHEGLTPDERSFLLTFEEGEPDWARFSLANLADLPAAQFKLLNIRKFKEAQPGRHEKSLAALAEALNTA